MILFPKARRRRPGIYLYRTRKHMRRGTEWGYGGMSTHLPKRALCHKGTCQHGNCLEKPWYDLVVSYHELRLPWWLGWKWFLLSIETVMIALTRPRYNDQKNPRRSKVRKVQQGLQRHARDMALRFGQPAPEPGYSSTIMLIGAALVVASIAGMVLSR